MNMTVDYSADPVFNHTLLAQGNGHNFLALSKRTLFKRNDGRKASYELEYRSLSAECNNERDEAYACVTYSELNFFQYDEIQNLLKKLEQDSEVDLFDYFNLY